MVEEESEGEIENEGAINVGDKMSCNWYQDGDEDQWYPCVILSHQ